MQKTCARGHVFEKPSDCPACPQCARDTTAATSLPTIGAPATRALHTAGVHSLGQLATWSERDLLALHGVGPKAMALLREALAAQGLAFTP